LREDLLHRLDVIRITVPPLRKRREDIPYFVEHFLAAYERRGLGKKGVTPRAMRVLQRYAWPGNVRELANTIERLMILSRRAMIDVGDLPENLKAPRTEAPSNDVPVALADVERRHIEHVVQVVGGNVTAAARRLGVHRNSLMRKLKRWGVDGGGRARHG
jgi:DNA-binding NtrC family response regulator